MDKVKEFIWTGVKNTGIAMTFGAYHLYVMDERWKLQQEILRLQDEKNKEILNEIRDYNKRKWF